MLFDTGLLSRIVAQSWGFQDFEYVRGSRYFMSGTFVLPVRLGLR